MLLTLLKKLDLPRASDLSKTNLYHLIAAYVLISLPMVQLFPIWIPALAVLTIGLKLAAMRFHFVVSKWLALAMLLGFGVLILANAMSLGKEYTGVALLFVFASLKILEAREQRDAFLLMLIYLLLIMGALMAQRSPLAFFYLVTCFLYNIYIQLKIAQPPELGLSLKHNLKSIAKILLVSAPFVIILFFLFPRLDPLWKTPGPPQATTGLSDEMTPNSLTSLAQDGGLAFRVQFDDGQIPPSQLLYWRGPVLVDYDGKTWRRQQNNNAPPQRLRIEPDSKISYRSYHNGATDVWVVPLDMPREVPKNAKINSNFEMIAPNLAGKPMAFSLVSYTQYQTAAISPAQRQQNTFLPPKLFPRSREFAAELRAQSRNDEDFVNRLWQYFRDNDFYYDLEPPRGNANIDTFFFENRVGYCEHYASTFAFMLRSQSVPTRIVTGYQGGERNPVSDEFEVKQLNAHAWTEVYLDGKGWVRYDPTAAVAPNRINRGSPFGSARNTQSISLGARWENTSATFKQLSASLRALNAFWQNWIINYDNDKQNSLWQRLGLGAFKYTAWLLLMLALAPVILLVWWWYRRRQAARYGDVIYRTMQPFFQYLHKHNVAPTASQGLHNWLRVNSDILGACDNNAAQVIHQYYRLRYQTNDTHTAEDLTALTKAITLFIEKHRLQQRQSANTNTAP